MEGKLLVGGKNIVDRVDEAKRAHEKMRQEMIEHKVSQSSDLSCHSFTSLSLSLSVVSVRFVNSLRPKRRVPWRSRVPSHPFRRKLT